MRGSVVVLIAALAAAGCTERAKIKEEARTLTGGDPDKGMAAIGRYGCAACHVIPGIGGASGTVGPPLTAIASRGYLAGHLPNSPSNMMLWIQQPQQIDRKTVMPNMGVTDEDARNITAYLYTLR